MNPSEKNAAKESASESKNDAGAWNKKASENVKKGMEGQRNLFRGLTMAYLENLRLTTNLFTNYMETVVKEDPTKAGDDPIEFFKQTTKNVLDGISDMINDSMDIPEKTIDKFYETYKGKEKATA